MVSLPVRPGDLIRARGERWRVSRCLPFADTASVDVDGCDAVNRGVRACFLLPYEPIERIAVCRRPRVVRQSEWRLVARRTLGDATATATSLRAATRAGFDLVPFQLEPAIAMLRGEGCRFLIADAVGLGKTVQAGLMVAELLARQPDARALVIVPAGLREQWRDELVARFSLHAVVMDATGVARTASALPAGLNPWSIHPLVITSIDYVKRPEVMRCLEPLLWDAVVLDEAHALAGRSDRAAAAAAVARRGRCVVMLTATPHSGDADGFRRMCDIGRLGDDEPLLLFSRTHADAGITRRRRTTVVRIRPTAAEQAMHDALADYGRRVWRDTSSADGGRLAISVLARRAASSAACLVQSVDRRLAMLDTDSEAAPAQLGLPFVSAEHEDVEPDWQLRAPGLCDRDDELARLRQIRELASRAAQSESKLRWIRRLLTRIQEPAIVFTEYRDTLRHVADGLTSISAVQLHGGLTSRERDAAVTDFTAGSTRVLLATDAASEGLNLHQRCRLVINLELPWTPLRLEQRAGRVDRIGQPRRVHALHLVAGGTSEESVLLKLARRLSHVRAVMGPLAYAPLPGDAGIADALFAGKALSDVPAEPPDLTRMRCCSLRDDAREEAARIHTSRMLLQRAATRVDSTRPIVTSFQSHTSTSSVWVFRTLLVDRDNREVRNELLALSLARDVVQANEEALRDAVDRIARDRIDAFMLEETPAVALWLAREERLSGALRRQRARLAAQLVQRGLFDHRTERLATAQSNLLELAVAQSFERHAHLTARLSPRLDSCELVFSVTFT